SCATTGSPTASSNPTTISSTIVVRHGTSSSISLGASCPSDCANGPTGSDQWDLVLGAGEMSLDEKVKAFLEFLRIAAWPALIAWLVWYFRDEVKRVITRITKLGLTGAEFAPPAEQVPTPPPKGVSAAAPSAQSPSGGIAPASPQLGSVQQFIDRIKTGISADQLDPSVQAIRKDLTTLSADQAAQVEALIPNPIDQNPWAHWRSPMDMMRQG